jgi:1,4-alpha-glucan branching enzyme
VLAADAACRHGVFEGAMARTGSLPAAVRWPDGGPSGSTTPTASAPVLGEMDAWLLAEGTHLRPFEVLGAHAARARRRGRAPLRRLGAERQRVSVVGDFNHWDGRRHPMRLRRECGVWEIFLPGVRPGARYKFELLDAHGHCCR